MQNACDRGADYLFLADQDDVWQADKLGKTAGVAAARRAGRRQADPPAGVFRLGGGGRPAADAAAVFLPLLPAASWGPEPLRTLLGRSFVLGCASGMNRPLLELALPLPGRIASHDWWVALCAAAAGQIAYLPQPTIWYRRHEGNASGPAGFWAGWNPWRHPWASDGRAVIAASASRWTRPWPCGSDWTSVQCSVTDQTRQCLDRFCTLFERPQPGLAENHRIAPNGCACHRPAPPASLLSVPLVSSRKSLTVRLVTAACFRDPAPG